MIKTLKHGYVTMYIIKERGCLYVRDKQGESRPIMYGVYDLDRNPIGLRDYINIRGIDIHKALEELEGCGAVLLGYIFEIAFYTEEEMTKFVELIEGFSK